MARDIAKDTLQVGNALSSVRIDQMILNLAKGIAWGQFELDKVGVDIARMMGAPGTVNIGGEQLSMLDAGFMPSFYHFVDTILEMKMEINIREESSSSTKVKETTSSSKKSNFNVSASVEGGFWGQKYKISGSYGGSSSSAYAKTVDSTSSQKFSQDLSASSLMRTKIVPVPPPDLLVERIKILLERLRKEAEREEEKAEEDALKSALSEMKELFAISSLTVEIMEAGGDGANDLILDAFKERKADYLLLKTFSVSDKGASTIEGTDEKMRQWIVRDLAENKYILASTSTTTEKDGVKTVVWSEIKVYSGGQTQKDLFSFENLLNISPEE